MEDRLDNPSAMDIFEIRIEKGDADAIPRQPRLSCDVAPTMKSIEMTMMASPDSRHNSRRGSCTWLARGLQIQQLQTHLRVEVKELSSRSTETRKLELARRRDRLESDISQFLSQATTYIGQTEEGIWEGLEWDADWSDAEDEDTDGDQDVEEALGNSNPHHAEETRLPLPSAVGRARCDGCGIGWLADEELELRKGEANDALHNLRIALADKSGTVPNGRQTCQRSAGERSGLGKTESR